MGHMSMDGHALSWSDTAPLADHIRRQGVAQFARVLQAWRDRPDDQFKWGDELEFIVVRRSHDGDGNYYYYYELDSDASTNINRLNDRLGGVARWNHEFGSYMIEATPLAPFTDTAQCLSAEVEESMRGRREALQRYFGDDHLVLMMPNYPLLGAMSQNTIVATEVKTNYTHNNEMTESDYVDDALINQTHPRFGNLARNIRDRRRSKVNIVVPIFKDTLTTQPDIHMDAMTFGMGCCCLQLTFQSKNICEARHLFDQFVVLAPIALALSAASPVYRGMLADIDCRWRVVSGSVDDRTETERDEEGGEYICKSRYASISRYLSEKGRDYNDLKLRYNESIIEQINTDYPFIDEQLKLHLAHLFIRDPLVVYDQLIHVNGDSMEHFNNIQSTNWQTVRFKPPTSAADGWRVEFRPMDIQFTSRENAALAIWSLLWARVVRHYNLDYCIPISLVDENMERADRRDAIKENSFWFKIDGNVKEYTMADIVKHINSIMCEYVEEVYGRREHILMYLQIVSDRADLVRPTNAAMMRSFMTSHEDYKRDSVITRRMSDDFIRHLATLE